MIQILRMEKIIYKAKKGLNFNKWFHNVYKHRK